MNLNKISHLVLSEDVDLFHQDDAAITSSQETEVAAVPPSVMAPSSSRSAFKKTVRFAPIISSLARSASVHTGRITPNIISSIDGSGMSRELVGTESISDTLNHLLPADEPVLSTSKKRKFTEVIDLSQDEARAAGVRAHQAARARRGSAALKELASPKPNSSRNEVEKAGDNFSRMLAILEKESILAASKLASDPAKIKLVLEGIQSFCRRLQSALGEQYRLHLLLESAMPGIDINKKYRGCIPIFSSTLLPAIEADVVGSSVVAVTICETLEIAERVCISDNAIRIKAFDLISTPKMPAILIPAWMPGQVVPQSKVKGDSALGLSALAHFDDSDSSAKEAAMIMKNMYPFDNPRDEIPALVPKPVDVSIEFLVHPSNFRRLLAPNPKVYTSLLKMSKKRFVQVYREFMYDVHEEGHLRDKFPGKIEFDRFNPPYFDGLITLLLPSAKHGSRLLTATELEAPSIPTVHSLDKGRGRQLAASLLTLFLEREKGWLRTLRR